MTCIYGIEVISDECIPFWQCEIDGMGYNTGYKVDGCGNKETDTYMCPPLFEKPKDNLTKLILSIGIGIGLLSIITKNNSTTEK